jgi:hypothetical protein
MFGRNQELDARHKAGHGEASRSVLAQGPERPRSIKPLKLRHFLPNNSRPKQRNNSGRTAAITAINMQQTAWLSAITLQLMRGQLERKQSIKNHARDAIPDKERAGYVPG